MAKDKTIIRTRKNRENPYVMVDKYCINDDRLSWKAKGLLIYLLSKPDDWTIMLEDLIKHAKDGRDSVKAGLRELETNGYMVRYQLRDENGKFGQLEFIVSERPQTFDLQDFLSETENPSTAHITGNGKSVNGKTVNGKSTTTNNDLTNNDSTNNDGWLGSELQEPNTDFQNTDKKENNDWEFVKQTCFKRDLDINQARDLMKVWKHYYPDASAPIVRATINEMMDDQLKGFTTDKVDYKNLPGLFHHRMKTWKSMQAMYEDE